MLIISYSARIKTTRHTIISGNRRTEQVQRRIEKDTTTQSLRQISYAGYIK
nr:MAG TPA: hypothetical protein [Caudoviricetes sp.]